MMGYHHSINEINENYKSYESAVDTLFKVKPIFIVFWLFGSNRNCIKTAAVEGLIVFQHSMNSME